MSLFDCNNNVPNYVSNVHNNLTFRVSSTYNSPEIKIDFSKFSEFPKETLIIEDEYVKPKKPEKKEEAKKPEVTKKAETTQTEPEKKPEEKPVKKVAKVSKVAKDSWSDCYREILELIREPQKFDKNKKTRTVKVDGQDFVVNVESVEEQKDGTLKVKCVSEDGNTRNNLISDKNGNVSYQEVVYTFADGQTRTEFYRSDGNTFFKGFRETYLDENGNQKAVAANEARDTKSGALIQFNDIDDNEAEGYSHFFSHRYIGEGLSAYEGTDYVQSYKTGENETIRRNQSGYMTEQGFVLDNDVDCITIHNTEGEKPIVDEIPTRALKIDAGSDLSSDFLTPDNINTDPGDIVKKGGKVVQQFSDGTKKTEFVREETFTDPYDESQTPCLLIGYTKQDKDGFVIAEYKKYYNPQTGMLVGQQMVKYNSETRMHHGMYERYSCPSGVVNELTDTYYLQGTFGKGMRYTEVTLQEDGTYSPVEGTDKDFIRFKSGNKRAASELQDYAT